MVYEWKQGTRHSVAPEVAAQVMDGLAKQGNLTAAALVDASRPEDAPLHGEFEWTDSIAAEKWREQQGRTMIAALVIRREDVPEQEPVRAYFKLEAAPVYEQTVKILAEDMTKKLLLEQAKRELKAFQRKYAALEELADVFTAIDKVG